MMKKNESGTEEKDSPAAIRAIELLQLLAQRSGELSLTELASKMGLAKSTVHRLVEYLCAAGYLTRDAQKRTFWIGPKLGDFALSVIRTDFMRSAIREVLTQISAEVGETVNIATLDGTEIIYLQRVETRWPLRLSLDLGSRIPVHCCASGKLFLAMAAPRELSRLLNGIDLDPVTPQTLTSIPALEAALNRIRECGYATDEQEFVQGMVAIAVPIRNPQGQVRASLSIHAPTVRCPTTTCLVERLPLLREGAARIEELMDC